MNRHKHGDPMRTVLLDWQPMDTAPTTGPVVWVRVKCRDGRVVNAHFACDLSGDEQPPFKGWFESVGHGASHFFSEVSPVGWVPLEQQPERPWAIKPAFPEYRR